MNILVLTSCTSQKKETLDESFDSKHKDGVQYISKIEEEADDKMLPALEMYAGQQHERLRRGLDTFSQNEHRVNLHILSAGYGLIGGSREIAPYECTFSDMTKSEIREWGEELNVPQDFRKILRQPFDLGIVMLGNDYLEACKPDEPLSLGGPTLFFCSSSAATDLAKIDRASTVPLGNEEASRFSCGLVGLKGELGARVLEQIADGVSPDRFFDTDDVLDLLETEEDTEDDSSQEETGEGPYVDYVIDIPESWKEESRQREMRYFIPEWDDRVDPEFDFQTETHSSGRGGWAKDVYAHQMYSAPPYDGILISKAVAEKTKKKTRRINGMGVHRYLRVPESFPIMGDCGAFDYKKEDEPPYDTEEMIEYYTRLGFDYGVSIDHLIGKASQDDRDYRYELTIRNAEKFLKEHDAQDPDWTPVGAVQGWDPDSYATAAEKIAEMGYDYIALGGLVRTGSAEIEEITESVRNSIPDSVGVHLFGVARLDSVRRLADLGVVSIDSSSPLRRAWTSSKGNYYTLGGPKYAAIRVPESGVSFRAKRMVDEGRASKEEVERLDSACMDALRAYDRKETDIETVLDTLDKYDHLITPDRDSMREEYRITLRDRPWEKCPCDICQEYGIEVIIFRGNNRNRRRGFHNTYVFQQLFQRALEGEEVSQVHASKVSSDQMTLFSE